MRWVRSIRPDTDDGEPRLGVVDGDTIRGGLAGALTDRLASGHLAEAGRRLAEDPPELAGLAGVRLLPPIATPPSVRDFMAFEQHVDGMGRLAGAEPTVPDVWYRQPLFYFSNPAAMLGPGDEVPVPPGRPHAGRSQPGHCRVSADERLAGPGPAGRGDDRPAGAV